MSPKKRRSLAAELGIFVFIALFFTVMAPVYWFSAHEIAGVWALGLAAAFGWITTGYFGLLGRHIDDRPEDDVDAEIATGAGELGFFPPSSIWPFWCALCISIIVLGPVFGWWLTILGAGLGIWALCGWVYEFYRGVYAH